MDVNKQYEHKEQYEQLVVFELTNQRYALPINSVSEIIRIVEVIKVPNGQFFMKGVINLRGAVIPVVSLSLLMGLGESDLAKESRIMVAEMDGKKLGLIVDKVHAVTRYSLDQLDKPELSGEGNQYIEGIVHQENGIILLLDPCRIMLN